MCHYCRPSTSGAAVSKPLKSKSHSNAVDRPHSSAQGQPRSKSSTSIKSRVPKVDPIRVDIDATVQRIEKHLDDIVTSPGGGEGDISDYHGDDHYHGDDILPESAEDMGPGTFVHNILTYHLLTMHMCVLRHLNNYCINT